MIDAFAIVEDLKRRLNLGSRELSFIELNRPAADGPTVALLAFVDGSKEPFAFVKATADPAKGASLRQEFGNLKLLEKHGSAAIRGTVPEPMYCKNVGGLVVLAESAGPGMRMKNFPPDAYFASRRFRSHFAAAVGWLSDLHDSLSGHETLPVAASGTAAADAIATFRATHSVSPALTALLDETRDALATASVPGVPSHGDFCTANIVVAGHDGLFVIDWEYPLCRTWPLADLLYLISSTWCVPYRKGLEGVRNNYRRLFFESHGYGDLLREATLDYATRLGVGHDLLLPLSVITWVGFANRKQEELRGRPDAAAGHLPLIMLEGDRCLNLEILAEHRSRYRLV